MVEGLVVTILSMLVVIWVGFSMSGRDEARVSASSDLNKWYNHKSLATIVDMKELKLKRDYVSLLGRGIQEQLGYRLTLEYKDINGYIVTSKHVFYDESEQDEEFLERYIKDNKIYVWLARDGKVYVPGEVIDNQKVQTIYGADKVLVYSITTSIAVGLFSTLFLLFISPAWVILHLPLVILSSVFPQVFMYIQEMSSEIQRKDFAGVSALNQFGLYIDESEKGVKQFKLVEQTLPMVLLEEGVGYLGYTPDKVSVLVDYDGNIPVHIASEYHIPEVLMTVIERIKGNKD